MGFKVVGSEVHGFMGLEVLGSGVQGSEFSPATGYGAASLIEKETSLEPNKFNNGNL